MVSSKERPILFSGPMVRAILAGQKTQTRRLVTVPGQGRKRRLPGGDEFEEQDGRLWFRDKDEDWHDFEREWSAPYAEVGDRLWVRETWYCDDYTAPNWWTAAGRSKEPPSAATLAGWKDNLYYRADATETGKVCELIPECLCNGKSPWRPSIFMQRWAARILLEVVAVRVERLQDITEEDARAEGVERDTSPCDHKRSSCEEIGCMGQTFRSTFCDLWESINGKRKGAEWRANPWVWVVTFRRLEAP